MAQQCSSDLDNVPRTEDFTITCGKIQKREFKVSRFVLEKSSLYFQTMFANNWKEVVDSKADFPEVEAEVMEIIIEFIKTQKFPVEYQIRELCVKVLECANLLEIPELFISCLRKLVVENMTLDNVTDLHDMAVTCQRWELEAKSKESIYLHAIQARIKCFMAQNFCQYAARKEFLKMDGDLLHTLLQHPELDTNSFDIIIQIMWKWMNSDLEKRRDKVELMRRDLAEDSDLCYQLLRNTQLKRRPSCEEVEQHNWKFSRCYPNHGQNLFLLKPNRVIEKVRELNSYTFTMYQWCKKENPSFSLLDCVEVVGYCGHVYLFGSAEWKAKQLITRVTRYFPCSDTKISVGNLDYPVLFIGATGLDGAIYILGNRREGAKTVNTIQHYCTVTCHCEEITMVDETLKPLGIWAANSYLYILCLKGSYDLNLMCFDPLSNGWVVVTSVPHDEACRYTMAANKLFLMKSKGMFTYDIVFDKWTSIAVKPENWAQVVSVSTNWAAIEVHGISVNSNMWPFCHFGKNMLLTFDNNGTAHVFDVEFSCWLSASDVKDFMPSFRPIIDTVRNCAMSNCAVICTSF